MRSEIEVREKIKSIQSDFEKAEIKAFAKFSEDGDPNIINAIAEENLLVKERIDFLRWVLGECEIDS
jgi:hypothetical protein